MPTISQLTTTTKVKLLLGITVSTDDTLLSMLCDWATGFIEKYCGKKWTDKTITDEIYSTEDFKYRFYLNYCPVKTISSFKKLTDKLNGVWTDLVEHIDYEVDLASGLIVMDDRDFGISDIKISYTVDPTTIPSDIEMIATELVAKVYNKRKSEGVSQEGLAEASITWGSYLSDNDKKILESYRRGINLMA